MTEFAGISAVSSPLIAVLTSNGADEIVEKNNFNFADMLAPFNIVTINIKDPIGNHVNAKLALDFRDIRRSGFLLSHTVLPHVLRENVVASFSTDPAENVFISTFSNSFLYWFEPANHDFLRAYVSCMFVVSVGDSDPMEELNRLQYQQHTQQHSNSDSSSSFTQAHCLPPKWMISNILKFFVLVQDISQHSDERAEEVFSTVTKKYGSSVCYLLRLNSTQDSQLPDPWAKPLERLYRGLNAGLERARREILENSNVLMTHEMDNSSQQYIPSSTQLSRSSTTSSFSTISGSAATNSNNNISGFSSQQQQNSLFTTSLTIPQILPSFCAKNSASPQNVPAMANGFIATSAVDENIDAKQYVRYANSQAASPSPRYGRCLDAGDRERLRAFVDEFARNALVPFVEHQLVLMNDSLLSRRSIGRSLNNVRKWLSAASSTTTTTNANVNYGPESTEFQTRCVADLAFEFGLYNFAHQLYQSLKKDFANDQAWLHHAGALEMAAVTSFLAYVSSYVNNNASARSAPLAFSAATISQLQKNYPQRYMDNAINYYLNVCLQPLLALRCVLLSVTILTRIELYAEAASHLVQLNTLNFSDLFAGVFLERAAHLFELAKKCRRMALYLMLAGHRFLKANLPQFALCCYRRVLPLLNARIAERGSRQQPNDTPTAGLGDGWAYAEDHVLYTLSAQHEVLAALDGPASGGRFAVECAARLLRNCGRQYVDQHRVYLANYVNLSRRYETYIQPVIFSVPQINTHIIRVFYGDLFKSTRAIHATTFASLATTSTRRLPFHSVVPEEFRPEESFHEIALEIGGPLTIWQELASAVLAYHNSSPAVDRGLKFSPKAQLVPLFSDEWTENDQSECRITPLYDPITLQLTLSNPLSVPISLHNLRLGVVVPNRSSEEIDSLLSVECLNKLMIRPPLLDSLPIPGGGRDSPRSVDSLTFTKSQNNGFELVVDNGGENSVVNLSVTPNQPMDMMVFDRLEFELCAPPEHVSSTSSSPAPDKSSDETTITSQQSPGIAGSIPLRIKGKRLFSNKNQRHTPTYSMDNRLSVHVPNQCWPLLDFRIAGNPSGRGAEARTLGCHRVSAYCDQIYQVLVDVENVGRMAVNRLYLATDRAELVSLSEERVHPQNFGASQSSANRGGRWKLCPSSWRPCTPALTTANGSDGLLIHEVVDNIGPQKPLMPGSKLILRMAFRAPATPKVDHEISVLFVYVDANGTAREFRYRLSFCTQLLLRAALRPLNPRDGLCALQLRNNISKHDSILARIELQRFAVVLLALHDVSPNEKSSSSSSKSRVPFHIRNLSSPETSTRWTKSAPNPNICIQPVFKNPVVLESEQSQNYCFFLSANNREESAGGELWLSDYVADIPEWSHLLPVGEFLPLLADGVTAALKTSSSKYQQKQDSSQLDSALSDMKLGNMPRVNDDVIFHLRLAVLWKAYITNSDGTVATVFGENLLSSPFTNADSALHSIPGSPYVLIATNLELATATVDKGQRASSTQSGTSNGRRCGSAGGGTVATSNPFTSSAAPSPTLSIRSYGSMSLFGTSRLAPPKF